MEIKKIGEIFRPKPLSVYEVLDENGNVQQAVDPVTGEYVPLRRCLTVEEVDDLRGRGYNLRNIDPRIDAMNERKDLS